MQSKPEVSLLRTIPKDSPYSMSKSNEGLFVGYGFLTQQRFGIPLRMEIADLHAYKIIINYLKFHTEWISEEEHSVSMQYTNTIFSKQEQRRTCHLK